MSITRRQILSVIGPEHGPSEVANILDLIREDRAAAMLLAAKYRGVRLAQGNGFVYVDCDDGMTLMCIGAHVFKSGLNRTNTPLSWRVAPVRYMGYFEALAMLRIIESLPHARGMGLNRVHVSAFGGHCTVNDTGYLLSLMVAEGVIRPRTAFRRLGDPRQWDFENV